MKNNTPLSDKLRCKWMSLNLKSPFIIASLTLVSNVSIEEHVKYYKEVYKMGAGAIVLPSINPHINGDDNINQTVAECLTFNTGCDANSKTGFTVLGPTNPNIISFDYGINLAGRVRKECGNIPIIGSIADLGTETEVLDAISALFEAGVNGIELNISCPNVITMGKDQCLKMLELLNKIRKKYSLPISLKLSPQKDYSNLLTSVGGLVDSLTLSNAYIGLMPPKITTNSLSPFKRQKEWAPSGVYGPFERLLTFNTLYTYNRFANENNLNIACAGGIVSVQDAIQALMLGADVVQFSSAVLWKSISVFEEYNNSLLDYMEAEGIDNLSQIKGLALQYIKKCSDDLPFSKKRKMTINDHKCRKCRECGCCNRLCIAIHQDVDYSVHIDKDLCSGCGMCMELCPNSAILMNYV